MEIKDNKIHTMDEKHSTDQTNASDGQTMGLTTALNKILTDDDINGSKDASSSLETTTDDRSNGQTMGLTTALNKIITADQLTEDNDGNNNTDVDIPSFIDNNASNSRQLNDADHGSMDETSTDTDPSDQIDDKDDDESYDYDDDNVSPPSGSFIYTLTHNKASIVLLILIIVLIIGIIIALLFFMGGKNERITVTNQIGSTSDQVKQWCENNQLDDTHCIFITQYSETVPEGNVIAQSIDSDQTISKNDVITFTISGGKDPDYEVTLPDFTTMDEQSIMQWFEDNLFTDVTYEYQVDETAEDGSFLSINITTPTARRSAAILVTFAISEARLGVEIEMPDLNGYTKANVAAWAAKNRINVTYINDYSDTIPTGQVITQSIKAGTMIKTGDKVTITISLGKAIVMQDFNGQTQQTASTWCSENGLKCTFTQSRYSTIEKGMIIAQSIDKDQRLSTNQTINFTLSLGSTIDIGDYTNKDYSVFEKQIESLNRLGAGLSIARTNVTTNTRADDNLITTNTKQIEINGKVEVSVNVYEAKQVTVPQCSGNQDAYQKSLETVGLHGSYKGSRYDDSIGNGNVMSCSINGGTTVNEGTYIDFYTSKGAYKPNANDFDGKTKTEVSNILSTARNEGASGWSISYDEHYNDGVAQGRTYGCSISGKTIYCNLSLGSEPTITVGNYIGQIWNSSSNRWDLGNGIILINIGSSDSTQARGTILTQSRSNGETIKGQSSVTVNVTVSKGPQDPVTNGSSWTSLCASGNSCVVNGITLNATWQYHDTVANGNIIDHSCDMSALTCSVNVSQGYETTTITLSEIFGFGVTNGASSPEQVMQTLRSSYSQFADRMSYEFGPGSYDFSKYTPYELYYVFNGERVGPFHDGTREIPLHASLIFILKE